VGCGWVKELVLQLGSSLHRTTVQFSNKFLFGSRNLGSLFFVAIFLKAIKSEN
jgi:hypothetical protein